MARLRAKYRKLKDGTEVLQTYIAEFYDPNRRPKRKRITLRTQDQKAAHLKFGRLEREYMAGLYDPWLDGSKQGDQVVSEAIALFLKSRRRDGLRETTLATYETILTAFAASLPPSYGLSHISPDDLRTYLDGLSIRSRTRESYLGHIRAFFRWAQSQGFIQDLPLPKRQRRRQRRAKTPEFLTEEQVETLCSVIASDAELSGDPHGNDWLLHVIRFAVGTGLRRGELCNLRWKHINLDARILVVRSNDEFQTKSGEDRSIPLVGDTLELLTRLRTQSQPKRQDLVFKSSRGGPIHPPYLTRRFRHYRRLARLPEGYDIHSLRHTFASWYVQRGGDLFYLKELLGHQDIKTTLVYAHLRPEAMRREMEKVFGSHASTGSTSTRSTSTTSSAEQAAARPSPLSSPP